MADQVHIALVYQDPPIDPVVVSGFDDDMRSLGLNIIVEPLPFMQYRGGIEWLLPTAIVVYLAKPYFESFLREMGKDHYVLAKTALNNLRARISAKYGDRLKIVSSHGKRNAETYQYSPIFSIEAESSEGYRYKLLIQPEIEEDDFKLAIEAFLNLMAQNHGTETAEAKNEELLTAEPLTSVVLMSFDPKSGALQIVQPFPKQE